MNYNIEMDVQEIMCIIVIKSRGSVLYPVLGVLNAVMN